MLNNKKKKSNRTTLNPVLTIGIIAVGVLTVLMAVYYIVKEIVIVEPAPQEIEAQKYREQFPDGESKDYQKEGLLKLGQYKGRTFDANPTEEEVDNEMEAKMKVKKDYIVKNGDGVIVDYEGKVDGVPFEGGSSEDYWLVVGSGEFLDEFEKGLVGKEVGSTFSVDVPFPKDYFEKSLQGKTSVFTITSKSCVPKITDRSIAEKTKNKYQTVSEYRKFLAAGLKKDKMETIDDDIWEELRKDTEFEKIPKEIRGAAKADFIMQYQNYGELNDATTEEILADFGMTDEDVDALAKEAAQAYMMSRTIASIENIRLDDIAYKNALVEVMSEEEEDEKEIQSLKESSIESLEEQYKEFNTHYPKDDMLLLAVKKFVVENAKVK